MVAEAEAEGLAAQRPRNILIFSDGTGQAGGLLPDERRSNIYKLYRGTRCGPDSTIDPSAQVAFYDPGLGSSTDDDRIKIGWIRWGRNLVSQATGLGITKNIIDCYAEIVRQWRPGDRIYLFGFSRGAYTVRCVGGVLGLCGVPTQMKDGSPLRRDPKSARAVAREAVKQVYQYGAGIKGDPFKDLRVNRAAAFRRAYASGRDDLPNTVPYFIGVFDTVAALGVTLPLRLVFGVIATLAVLVASAVPGRALSALLGGSFWGWSATVAALSAIAVLAAYAHSHFTWHPGHKRFYRSSWSMRFYDTKLNRLVPYARQALAIDERRADFEPVLWDEEPRLPSVPAPMRQIWFAGNHSDIGGSYVENEARLSDITLEWMVEQLDELPHSIDVNDTVLHLYPSAAGPQHDECKAGFPGLWGMLKLEWKSKLRSIDPEAPLHPSVLKRLALPEVLDFDVMTPYRPEALRFHGQTGRFFRAIATTPERRAKISSTG
jgi:uncharacterized protein (DUF2235 family)